MFRIISNAFRLSGPTIEPGVSFRQFHAIPNSISCNTIVTPAITNQWSLNSVRTAVREFFPVAREYKRLKTHGWRVKLKTKNGRRQLMRRILKGRYYLAH